MREGVWQLLTIFSAPKPFEGQIGLIQRNAIRSWLALDRQVQVIVIGDERGAREVCNELEVHHVPDVERNEFGTPVLSSIFSAAEKRAEHEWMCYVNADILLTPDMLTGIKTVTDIFDRFLIVGQRWDIEVDGQLAPELLRGETLQRFLVAEAELHSPSGSDYFVYRRGMYTTGMPHFALGRSGWDNWMIYHARSRGISVVDASRSITVIHQNHDYGHLPGGQSHYRLPESHRNVKLGGGLETIFTLRDATHRLVDGEIRPIGPFERGLARSLEAAIYTRIEGGRLRTIVRLLIHPIRTFRYLLLRVQGPRDSSTLERELDNLES